jgi:hypothetical protein
MFAAVEHNGVAIQTLEDESDDGTITVTFDDEFQCTICHEVFADKPDADEECPEADEDGGTHQLGYHPLGWLNHASITMDAEKESVTVSISVGDPRGAFSMEITRNEEGRIIMFVPYEGQPMPHLPIRQLHPGSYAVNEQPQS